MLSQEATALLNNTESPNHAKTKRIYVLAPILLQAAIYAVLIVIFKIFARIKYEGVENVLGVKGRIIFAANHSSEFDGPLIRMGLPFFWPSSPMYYVSMAKQFYTDSGWRKTLYGGHLFNLLGAYPIYSGKHDYAYSLQNHLEILRRGRVVCIFPEGRRTRDGNLGRAHGGVAFLAHTTAAPIIPVTTSGLVNLTLTDFLLFRRKVIIRYGKPIPANIVVPQASPKIEDYQLGAQYIMTEIAKII